MELPAAFGRSWAHAQNSWNLLRTALLTQFLKLAIPGGRYVAFGSTTLKFAGSKIPDGPKSVPHGLVDGSGEGVTPLVVLALSSNNVVTLSTNFYNSTTFQLWGGNWFEPLTGEVTVRFIAIG